MNLVFLCTSSLDDPLPRGRCLPIARELAAMGHRVSVLLLHHSYAHLPPSHRWQTIGGVTVGYVGQMHVQGVPGQRRYFSPLPLLRVSVQSALALAGHAWRLRPDAIHVEKPQPVNGLAGVLASRGKTALYVDYDDYEAAINRFDGAWQRWVVQGWEDHLPPRARAVSTNTRFIYDRCRHHLGIPPERLVYLPNGLTAGQCQRPPSAQVRALRATLGLTNHPTVIYLGHMSTLAHGVDLLLEAFALLLPSLPAARLLMVGDGDERPMLQSHAARLGIGSAVLWTGRVPPSATRGYLSLADCSVDPVYDTPVMRSRSPLKIFESLGVGVPVVTGDVGDRREILADGAAGLLVQPGCARSLADGLLHLLSDPALQRDISRRSQEQAAAYRWERLAQRWIALYENQGSG
jgi:glycosyltransferase involved in cell wall biosynthesis